MGPAVGACGQLKEEEQLQIVLQQKRRQQAEVLGELTKLCRTLEQGVDGQAAFHG